MWRKSGQGRGGRGGAPASATQSMLRNTHQCITKIYINRLGGWDDSDLDLALLGTDLSFFTAFLTSFLFNWVGFLLLMCFCHTIAARYIILGKNQGIADL